MQTRRNEPALLDALQYGTVNGIAVGLVIGLPLGAFLMWLVR